MSLRPWHAALMYNRAMVSKQEFEERLHHAMRAGNDLEKRTLRMVLSAWKLAEVERGGPLDDSAALGLLQKEAKSRQEAIADAERAGRPELVAAAQAEWELLQTYLPAPLSEQELEQLARQAISETGAQGPQQMGQVMAALMPRVQGRADGKRVSQVVRNLLAVS